MKWEIVSATLNDFQTLKPGILWQCKLRKKVAFFWITRQVITSFPEWYRPKQGDLIIGGKM